MAYHISKSAGDEENFFASSGEPTLTYAAAQKYAALATSACKEVVEIRSELAAIKQREAELESALELEKRTARLEVTVLVDAEGQVIRSPETEAEIAGLATEVSRLRGIIEKRAQQIQAVGDAIHKAGSGGYRHCWGIAKEMTAELEK